MERKTLKSLGQFDLVEIELMEVPEIIKENQITVFNDFFDYQDFTTTVIDDTDLLRILS